MIELEEDSLFSGLNRTCLSISSTLAEPYCWAYGMLRYRSVSPLDPNQFDNAASKGKEIGARILIFTSAALCFAFAGTHLLLASIALAACSQVFRAIGISLQKEGFTHIRTSVPEKTLKNNVFSAMTWNIRGYFGGAHYKEGGVVHWRSRLDGIVARIKQEDPDLLVLQEIYDTSLAEALVKKLGDRYAHFFTQCGATTWGSSSGCMVMTKCAVADFSHTNFEDNHWAHNRGFEMLEIKADPKDPLPSIRIIGTELLEGKEGKKKRMQDLSQIVNHLAQKTLPLPTFLIGAINAERDGRIEGEFLEQHLYHSYWGNEPTHTDELASRWQGRRTNVGKMIDFISLVKRNLPNGVRLPTIERNIHLIDCHIVEGFGKHMATPPYDLSDHHGLFTKLRLAPSLPSADG